MGKQYDENMIVNANLGGHDVEFYDVENDPFRIYGVWREGEGFCRMPRVSAEAVSAGIAGSVCFTAGGRVRFVTDSNLIAIKAEYAGVDRNDLTPLTATAGFDLYVDGRFEAVYRVPQDISRELVGVREIAGKGEHLITLNMPTSAITKLYIGVARGAKIKRAPDYKYEKPVVFYGSSVTNGSCASRPGMIYENQISRRLDVNFHNLGFGGIAKGEPAMAEYIAGIDMSAFVLDYDYNAPTNDHLEATHERFFQIVREKNPTLPIIMISRPSLSRKEDTPQRFEIIKKTYENAVAKGDKNVYLINGIEFFGDLAEDCTVDGVHPTDLGFFFMANRISEVLAPLLK